MSSISRTTGPVLLALALVLALAGCGVSKTALVGAVEGLLSAAAAGDEAKATAAMPSLARLDPDLRKKALAELGALGAPNGHKLARISKGSGGYVVSLTFGEAGGAKTLSFPVSIKNGRYEIGDLISSEEHIDRIELGGSP